MAKLHKHPDGYGAEFWCDKKKCIKALEKAQYQKAEQTGFYETLADMVADLPVGTIFMDTDDLGRKTEMMRVWSGVITNNGFGDRPFTYGDSWDWGYSIKVTHTSPQPLASTLKISRKDGGYYCETCEVPVNGYSYMWAHVQYKHPEIDKQNISIAPKED